MNAIKLTYIIIGASMMLASCAKDETMAPVLPTGDNRITFHSSFPDVTSRAQSIGKDDLLKFNVTAFNPLDTLLIDNNGNLKEFIKNVTVDKDEYSNYFKSDFCLWPAQGREEDKLTFFAFSPSPDDIASATIENASKKEGEVASFDYRIKDFHVATDMGDQVDFIAAYATGSMKDNLFSGVKLEFNHKLSRIEVRAKSNNKSCKLEIAGVRIGCLRTYGTFKFKEETGSGDWTLDETKEKEVVQYIYRPGDKIVALDSIDDAVSIMGGPDGISYAMLLPNKINTSWDFANDHTNANKGLYLSVLLRVIDKTTENNQTTDKNYNPQKYPYLDNTQGLNAKNMPRVYLAVDKDGNVTDHPGQLYKDENGKYYTDKAKRTEYKDPKGGVVKEFGWAAVPITGSWEAGYSYTYTLDYSYGVGLHDPEVKDPDVADPEVYSHTLKAGDPIISDKIGVTVSVKDWQTDENQVEVPGS